MDIIKNKLKLAAVRGRSLQPGEVGIRAVTEAERRSGTVQSQRVAGKRAAIQVLPLVADSTGEFEQVPRLLLQD